MPRLLVITLLLLGLLAEQASADRVIVRFDDDTSARSRAHAREDVHGSLAFTLGGLQVVDVPDATAAAADLRADAGVAEAFPDPVLKLATRPNDPRFSEQWALENTGQYLNFDAPVGIAGMDLGILDAWRWTRGAGAPPLAVVDTGYDEHHPDLSGTVALNTDEIANNGIDDDANGYVDDRNGWDFVNDRPLGADPHSHGTAVGGAVVANTDNGIGVAGLAPDSKVLPLATAGPYGGITASAVGEALLYAHRQGARVATMSFGAGSDATRLYMEAAAAAVPDMLLIAAAGNAREDRDLEPDYPCMVDAPNVLCVAASDNRGALASWSAYGATTVDLAAPGDNVLVPGYSVEDDIYGYGWASGTSISVPYVAGTAQLLLAVRPDLSIADLRSALLETGTPHASLTDTTVTGRRLDPAAALERVAGPLPEPVRTDPSPASPSAPTPSAPSAAAVEPPPTPVPAAVPAPAERAAAPRAMTMRKPAPKNNPASTKRKPAAQKPARRTKKKAARKPKRKRIIRSKRAASRR